MGLRRRIDAAKPLTANEFLVDQAIRQAFMLERFKASVRRQIVGFLRDSLFPDLLEQLEGRLNNIATRGFDRGPATTRRLRDMIGSLDALVQTAATEWGGMLRKELNGLASSESEWQRRRIRDAFHGTLPVDFSLATPSPQLLQSVVTARPFQGKHLRDEVRDWSRNTRRSVRESIQIGIAQGEPVARIVQRIRGTRLNDIGSVQRLSTVDAQRIVRTSVNHVSTHARNATFEANKDIVDKVQWVATLDSRTSPICASFDGTVYPINSGPRPPAHPNCRSTIVPVIKPFSELGIPGLKDVATGDRAARGVLNGRVPEQTTFGDWWKRQPRGVQNEVFGRGKADLLRKGQISFKDLVDQTGRPLTLQQLREKGEVVARAPRGAPRSGPPTDNDLKGLIRRNKTRETAEFELSRTDRANNRSLYQIKPEAFEEAWRRNRANFVNRQGGGFSSIEGRVENFERFVTERGFKGIQAATVKISIDNGVPVIDFIDGRHRTRWMLNNPDRLPNGRILVTVDESTDAFVGLRFGVLEPIIPS